MRRVISLSGTVLVLLCIFLVLVAAPAGAQDDPDTTPPADSQYEGPADDQYKPIDKPGGPQGPVDTPKGVKPDTVVGKQVPNTGGPPILVLAAGALLSAALIAGRGILRR